MTRPVAIDVADVSLAYKLYKKPSDLLWESLTGGIRHDTFWALKNISLQVHEGQRLGLIGPNGAGKSTLLQIIAGNLAPTSGKAVVHGKISSLLSLSPVWNIEDTGVENVKFNLLVQGVAPKLIPRLTEDIVEFTDLGAFMYQPVKTYSAGMSARLAFAIATAIEPEILIIDEVLGAGDGYFAAKATRRMREMCERGKALLFVSHSTSAVRQLCNTCIWLENGAIKAEGPAETVLRQYEEDMLRQDEETLREGNKARMRALKAHAAPEDFIEDELIRLRIRAEADATVHDTHYVRKISIRLGEQSLEVPIELADIKADDAALELFSCQWGRIFDRGANTCRTLQPRSGARKGGHILIRPRTTADNVPVEITFESSSLSGSETLIVDALDANAGAWTGLSVKHTPLSGGWIRTVASGALAAPNRQSAVIAKQSAALVYRRPVEIVQVDVMSFGYAVASVDEFQPFSIRVTTQHHQRVPRVSVNLNLVRSDGTFAFYQPSGMNDNNIHDHLGRSIVEFHFDPNPFGAGDYELNIFAVNGFDWDNIPPTEIFDRSIGLTKLRVNMKRAIEFGLVNLTARVETKLEDVAVHESTE